MEKMPAVTLVPPLDVLECLEIAQWLWDVPLSTECVHMVCKVIWLRSVLVHQ